MAAADGEQGALLEGGGNGRAAVGSGGTGGKAAGCTGQGTVALVCLQFSDPPYRRQALVSGQEGLVDEIAAALGPGGEWAGVVVLGACGCWGYTMLSNSLLAS